MNEVNGVDRTGKHINNCLVPDEQIISDLLAFADVYKKLKKKYGEKLNDPTN